MKKMDVKKMTTMSLSAMMIFSATVGTVSAIEGNQTEGNVVEQLSEGGTALQSATTYQEGVTVVADDNSRSGYTAHFVYNLTADLATRGNGSKRSEILEAIPEDAEIVGVDLVGSFRLHSDRQLGEAEGHSLVDYQPGDFAANVWPTGFKGEWTFENLETDNEGNYVISMPMISGAHYYYYNIKYTTDGGTTVRKVGIDDPKNVSPCRVNEENSDSETGDITHSIVYGKYSTKQGDTPNLDYMTPYEGTNKGTVQYVEYKGSKNNHQDLGIYLPAGYDANRAEPYKVIYMSHGAGGNETYWLTQPQGANVMDHMISQNPGQEAIIVSMDNTLYNWDYYQIGENVTKFIIPYMETNYNVSKEAKDRAFAGFSMGSMTTTYMAFNHADKFGYFGIFSGTNAANFKYEDGFEFNASRFNRDEAYRQEALSKVVMPEDLLNSVVFTQAGNYDTAVYANGWSASQAYETIRDLCDAKMPAAPTARSTSDAKGYFVDGGFVCGSHDIYTWGQCLYNFAKDVVWQNDKFNVSDEDRTDTPKDDGETSKPEDKNDSTGNGDNTPTVDNTKNDNKTDTKKDDKKNNSVKTGDTTDVTGLVAMMALASGGICIVRRKKETE